MATSLMEPPPPVRFSPHLKKVLKSYQLSATKSLQGPSTLLTPKKEESAGGPGQGSPPDHFTTPPPLPIQQIPILTAPDRSPSERSQTVLEGESITCFVVGGEKRLCLPQILNSILSDFTLPQINAVCDELLIFCSRCNEEQLEELKETGTLPRSAPSCGLITKTDAERLCSTLLHRPLHRRPHRRRPPEQDPFAFTVFHECFGKCKGLCLPALYTEPGARCIECLECQGLLSPKQFVCHSHRSLENRTCHWGFDSDNWRSYLLIVRDQPDLEAKEKLLDLFKEQHLNNNKLRQLILSAGSGYEVEEKESRSEEREEVVSSKKLKLDDGVYCTAAAYIPTGYEPSYYYTWYDPFLRPAFRPWALPPANPLDEKHPHIRDSVPTFLSHDPPVLLNPERVVPLSDSERFERTYQPNVALAPPNYRPPLLHDSKRAEVKTEVGEVDRKPSSSLLERATKGGAFFNSEMELSTDTDDSASDHRGTGNAVEQVAEVFAALSDTKETTRQFVVSLVERLAGRLNSIEAENRRLHHHNAVLMCQVEQHEQKRRGERVERSIPKRPASAPHIDFSFAMGVKGEGVEVKGVVRSSPVSVITSPPMAVVKLEVGGGDIASE